MYQLNCSKRATFVHHIYSRLITSRQRNTNFDLPVVSVVDLFVGIVSLSNAFFRCRVDESKGVHSAELDDSAIL